MKMPSVCVVISIIALLTLPGCGRIIDWGQQTFYQGELLDIDYTIPRSFLQSAYAYDQFATVARFDVLWLSPEVRTAYVDVAMRIGDRKPEQRALLLKKQQDESNHYIVFYVATPQDIALGEINSYWMTFLKIDELTYDPIEIKVVELNPIYRAFFGEKYNRFRTIYQIKFDARDAYNNSLIDNHQTLTLYFRSIARELKIEWPLNYYHPSPDEQPSVYQDLKD